MLRIAKITPVVGTALLVAAALPTPARAANSRLEEFKIQPKCSGQTCVPSGKGIIDSVPQGMKGSETVAPVAPPARGTGLISPAIEVVRRTLAGGI